LHLPHVRTCVPVVQFDITTHGMATLLSPTQFAVPSFALIPAVMPKGGMRDASTEPEEPPEEAPAEGEAPAEEEPPDGELVAAAGAVEVLVMKVLG
jgi:hypothetical protein